MSLVVVGAVIATEALYGLTDPAFLAAVATLITALTGLLVVIRTQGTAKATQGAVADTHDTLTKNSAVLQEVKVQTNGGLDALRQQVAHLQAQAERAGLPTLPASAWAHAGLPEAPAPSVVGATGPEGAAPPATPQPAGA